MSGLQEKKDYIPQIEGRLYSWAESLEKDRPRASISKTYRVLSEYGLSGPARTKHRHASSPQERWATANHDIINNATVIERTLRRMPQLYRDTVFLRYVLHFSWRQISDMVDEPEHRLRGIVRNEALRMIAEEFGILGEEEAG